MNFSWPTVLFVRTFVKFLHLWDFSSFCLPNFPISLRCCIDIKVFTMCTNYPFNTCRIHNDVTSFIPLISNWCHLFFFANQPDCSFINFIDLLTFSVFSVFYFTDFSSYLFFISSLLNLVFICSPLPVFLR